jgi:GT2 family glycosyltransferase
VQAIFGSYDANPADPGFFSQYKNLYHHFVHQHANISASTFWSGCGAIRKETFLRVGGFPEGYSSASIEDVELGYKLAANNNEIDLVKDIQVTHLKRWNLITLIKADILYRAIPWTRLAARKGLPYDLNFKLGDRISAVASLFLFLSLVLVWRFKFFVFVIIASTLTLLYLNQSLYKFFSQKKGFTFAVRAALFHWVYFFYSSIVFICYSIIMRVKPNLRR